MAEFQPTQSKKVVLLGFGRTSRPLAERVQEILKEKYHLDSELPPENEKHSWSGQTKTVSILGAYRDNELGSKCGVESAERIYHGAHAYIVQRTRTYDDTLEFWARDLEKTLKEIQWRINQEPELAGMFGNTFLRLEDHLARFRGVVDTGGEKKYAALRSIPDHDIRKVLILADRAKRYGAESVVLASPKSSYEWSHNAAKYAGEGLDESNTLAQTVMFYRQNGISGWVAMHFHAPHDVLKHARSLTTEIPVMNIIDVNPQSYVTFNGEMVRLEEIFSGLNLGSDYFRPFDPLIRETIVQTGRKFSLEEELAKNLVVINCSDQGALRATEEVACHYGLSRITSQKARFGEGDTERNQGDSLFDYLDRITTRIIDRGIDPHKTRLEVTILNMDDKLNSGGTANTEAKARKDEIEIYNKGIRADVFTSDGDQSREENYKSYIASLRKQAGELDDQRQDSLLRQIKFLEENPEGHGTRYSSEFHLYCSHIRTPDLRRLKHRYIDRFVVSDSVPYFPPLLEQLKEYEEDVPGLKGIHSKFRVLEFSADQIAAGIALDFYRKDERYKAHIDSLRTAA
ncbi:MAG: hypothetical protein AABX04_01860 [Nanoarchaeota archaeon]